MWHKLPEHHHHVSSGGKRPLRAVRYTWAGPFNTQLYDAQLTELSKQTRDNLYRLAGNIKQSQSQDQYGNVFQPELRSSTSLTPSQVQPSSQRRWSNVSVMFTDVSTMDSVSRRPDDASSVISTSSGAMNFCYLCSTMEEHQRNHLKLRVPVPLNWNGTVHKKKQRIHFIAPPPRTKKKIEQPLVVQEALYKVTVYTADIPGAGTNANVHITIIGDQDILPKTKLWRRQGTSKFCFVRGSKEVFHLKGPKLGDLRMLTIEHDGLEKQQGWYLDRIEVQCMQTHRVWVFLCKNWLSMHHGDFRTKWDLEAQLQEKLVTEYEVTVETGSSVLAGTDAQVYMTLQGTKGRSPKYHLNAKSHGTYFQRGQTDKLRILVPDIGDIQALKIEHDGTGVAAGWFLEKITLKDVSQPEKIDHFAYHGWLAKDVGDGRLWRELRAKKHIPREVKSGKLVHYEVTVKTGDVQYAGTNANVYVIFVGTNGRSAKLLLNDSRNNFERGMTESFTLKAVNVGTLKSITLGHDNSGLSAGWFCEYVKVKKHLTRQEITTLLAEQKRAWKTSKQQQQNKRLAEKLAEKENITVDDDSTDSLEENSCVKKDENFAGVFDRDGNVLKEPVYEDYFFCCSAWLANDEADGLLERELDVQKYTVFFQQR